MMDDLQSWMTCLFIHPPTHPPTHLPQRAEEDAEGKRPELPHHAVLIVVPASVIQQWANEIEKWGHFTVHILKGPKEMKAEALDEARIGAADILICSYHFVQGMVGCSGWVGGWVGEMRGERGLSRWMNEIHSHPPTHPPPHPGAMRDDLRQIRFRLVVFDEFHKVKSKKSDITDCARYVLLLLLLLLLFPPTHPPINNNSSFKPFPPPPPPTHPPTHPPTYSKLDALVKIGLTGTPIQNKLEELWCLCSIVVSKALPLPPTHHPLFNTHPPKEEEDSPTHPPTSYRPPAS